MIRYSTYDAKARFSEVLRLVREGQAVTITYRGEPVAEIRPIEELEGSPLDGRLQELGRRGEVVRGERRGKLETLSRKPGALQRFLEERDQ
ncbi:MAG: type II toxin-antitoxin system prevent-host-death family antitoxin [Gemmatimonadota bacterium]